MSKQEAQLSEWLNSMGVAQQFSSQDIQSGRTVSNILRALDRQFKITLQQGNSAINRVTNWNAIIQYLKKIGIKLSQQQKGKILNGNHDLVFRVISKLRQQYQQSAKQTQINLKDIDPKKQIKDADSLLQLFLLAIIKHFSLSPKQALSLLSNDGKYLAHILAKGLKNDFRPIDALIIELNKNLPKIASFAKNKENQLFFLKSIKPSLISKSQSVAQNTLNLIAGFLSNYDKQSKITLMKDYLTPTLMLVIRRHSQLSDKVIQIVMQSTDFNQLILNDLYDNTSKQDLSILFISLWKVCLQANKKNILNNSKIYQKLISHINNGFKDPDSAISCIGCSLEVAATDFASFQTNFGDKLVDSIREIVSSKQAQNIQLVHLLFSLLSLTGQQKHPLAPIIYKLLHSRIPHANDVEYQILILGFHQLLADLPSIPPTPIIDSLSQRQQFKLTQLQLSLFVKMISIEPQARVAVTIYNIVSRCFVQQLGMGRQLSLLLLEIVSNYKQQDILIDMTTKLIKVCLALYFANIKKLSDKRKPLSHKTKLDPEQAITKLKLLQIQFFLKRTIEIHHKDILSNLEPLICFTYLQIIPLGKQHNKGLESIVALLGDPNKLINKYQKELDIDHNQNKSKVKHQSPHSNDQEEGNSTEEVSDLTKNDDKKRSSSVHPLHPMSLSLALVKPDAYLGLQKYSKRHQVKALAQQSKRYQVMQIQQDKNKLKKLYEKKMVLQKGLKYKGINDLQLNYLFQFNSKQIYAENNQLYLNFYSPQAQQQRDSQGVQQFIKRYQKVLKVYYNIYSGKKSGVHTKNFDQILEKSSHIHTSAIIKMLKDHALENLITPNQIRTLARRVNYKLNLTKDDPEQLDFEGFKQFITQMTFTMYTRPPKDLRGKPVAEMLEQLFSTLKLYAGENRVNSQMFNQPEACITGQEQAVKLLNRRLQQNPDYILPQGYKKVTETRIFVDYKIYLQAMSPTYKQVYQVLDQILFQKFKFHIVEPFTKEQKICWARPNIYALERSKINQVQSKHLPIYLKKEVAKFPILDRVIAKQAASAVSDMIQAIEMNHEEVGLKHENPVMRSKRQRQQQMKRAKQAAEQKRKNLQRQLKTSMESYKQARQQKLQKTQQIKKDEADRIRQQKEKRQKKQKQLKEKLQQFNNKKKEEEEAKKANQQSRIEKEKLQAERKKRQAQQTKRKIEEIKKQKQQEEKQRKEKEKEDQKRRKQEQRQKYQRTQREKKQKIQQFKEKKKKGDVSKVIDPPQNEQKD